MRYFWAGLGTFTLVTVGLWMYEVIRGVDWIEREESDASDERDELERLGGL